MSAPDDGGPAVTPDDETMPFLVGLREDVFLLKRCRSCQAWCEPAALWCHACRGDDLEWEASSGCGRILSYSTERRRDRVRTLVMVELSEGPWWWTALSDEGVADVELVGLAVRMERSRAEVWPVPIARLCAQRGS